MTDRIADRGLVNEPVYITDLSVACNRRSAVGAVPAFHRWRAMSYTAGDLSGEMLLAGPETAAPDVDARSQRQRLVRGFAGPDAAAGL